MENKEKITFVKIDIQGAEALLFEGGKKFFKIKKPIVFLEFWPVGISESRRDYKKFLHSLNKNFKLYATPDLKEICEEEILAKVNIKKRNYLDLLCIPRNQKKK